MQTQTQRNGYNDCDVAIIKEGTVIGVFFEDNNEIIDDLQNYEIGHPLKYFKNKTQLKKYCYKKIF